MKKKPLKVRIPCPFICCPKCNGEWLNQDTDCQDCSLCALRWLPKDKVYPERLVWLDIVKQGVHFIWDLEAHNCRLCIDDERGFVEWEYGMIISWIEFAAAENKVRMILTFS